MHLLLVLKYIPSIANHCCWSLFLTLSLWPENDRHNFPTFWSTAYGKNNNKVKLSF